ncbi:MAG: Crp/Fnr family transcriptional regulator [Terriglobales bacterium]
MQEKERELGDKTRSKSQKTRRKQDLKRTDTHGTAIENAILLNIPQAEYGVIRPHLEFVKVGAQQSLHKPGQRLEYGYFPNQGMVSIVIEIRDGRTLEVGVVTRRGFAGESLAFGQTTSPYHMICQPPGDGFRVKAEVLSDILRVSPDLQSRLRRYVRFQFLRVSQIAACNRFHEIEQRLARWLLMSQDRIGSEVLPFTHEFLASMLGTGRAIVSIAASVLQKAGLIQYRRGTVKILDRASLEDAACECYRVIKQFEAEIELDGDRPDPR